MIAGPIAVAFGFLSLGNDIAYPTGDPRGEPWYGLGVLAISVIIGVGLFTIGLVRLIQSGRH